MRVTIVLFTLCVVMSVAWAVTPIVMIQSATATAFPDDAEYISHTQCKVCHNAKADGEQWNVWQSMGHAGAFETLKSEEAKKAAEKAGVSGPPSEAAECLQCHVTGYDPVALTAPAKIKATDGVQCESCHGPASLHNDDGKKLKFSKDKAGDIDVTANLTKIAETTCTVCHNEKSPTWNPERYTAADGSKTGFDFEQAKEKIAHLNPKKAH